MGIKKRYTIFFDCHHCIVKGRINVYINKTQDDGKVTAHYFLQNGDQWPLIKMTPESFREMTKDNEEAYAVVKTMKNIVTNDAKMEKAVKIYNE